MHRIFGTLLLSAVAATSLAAQSTNYYILDGDSDRGFIVRNGAVQSTFALPKSNPVSLQTSQYALRFQGSNFLVSERSGGGAVEYDATGTATGVTFTHAAQNFDELLDGTSDGTYSYSARCCSTGGGIIRADLNFGGMTELTPNFTTDLSGIAYAASTNSLFVSDFGGTIYEMGLDGSQRNSWSLGISFLGSLAYESSTNSLWGAVNGSNQIVNISLGGTVLNTINVTGGLEGNFWGGEMAQSATVVPEPSTYALMATGFAGLAVAARRRRAQR
jgi:hypothetical protein